MSSQVLRIQKMTLHMLVHLGDGSTIPIRVHLGILLARGVILLPSRGVGSRTIRLPKRARLLQIADNGTISRMTGNIFVMFLWLFCWTTSWECFQPSPNPWSSLLPTISRLRGCRSGRWVVSTVLQSRLVWTLTNRLRFGPNSVWI